MITLKKCSKVIVALGLVMTVGLTSCTLNVRGNNDLVYRQSNLIRSFAPVGGQGANYAVGDEVKLKITTAVTGYLTILALTTDGSAYPLIQNAYIPAGNHTFPRPEDYVVFNSTEPKGMQRLRAIFTKVRPTTSLVLGGTYDEERWNAVTGEYLSPYAAGDRDVLETYIVVR